MPVISRVFTKERMSSLLDIHILKKKCRIDFYEKDLNLADCTTSFHKDVLHNIILGDGNTIYETTDIFINLIYERYGIYLEKLCKDGFSWDSVQNDSVRFCISVETSRVFDSDDGRCFSVVGCRREDICKVDCEHELIFYTSDNEHISERIELDDFYFQCEAFVSMRCRYRNKGNFNRLCNNCHWKEGVITCECGIVSYCSETCRGEYLDTHEYWCGRDRESSSSTCEEDC